MLKWRELRLPEEIMEMAKIQFQKALDTIKYVPTYIDIGDYNGAINRTYYAAFYAIKAVELLDEFDSKKHSGVIAYFRQNYIKTNIFDSKYSETIGRLFAARQKVDYNLIAPTTVDDAKELYTESVELIEEIKNYLDDNAVKIG